MRNLIQNRKAAVPNQREPREGAGEPKGKGTTEVAKRTRQLPGEVRESLMDLRQP
jgi:hypothetical protein